MLRCFRNPGPVIGLAGVALAAGAAHATWSILIVDTRTGEIALGSATCVTGFDLREETPVIVTGVGAATAQSAVDSTGQNRVFLRDRLLDGLTPDEILDALDGFDGGHQTRQYGIVDVRGGAATFSGSAASDWKGGFTGRIEAGRPGPDDDLVYSVQGNILTGEPVVAMAVHALETTPGDLGERLMAAMEAAAAWGGDGRCSCPDGAPTSCGSPPPAPFKSAHVGYMLISRPGDRDVCPSVYGTGDRPAGVLAMDIDAQSGVDVVLAPASGSTVVVMRSSTSPGDVFPTLDATAWIDVGASRMRGLAAGDVTGDGVVDLVVSSQTPAQIRVLEGSVTPGGLDFTPAQTLTASANPHGVVVADLDGRFGLDVAFVTQTGEELGVSFSDGLGGLTTPVVMSLPGRPTGIAAADLDGDTDTDLAVSLNLSDSVVTLVNDGSGAFALGETLATPARPLGVLATNLDADGEVDLVVATANGQAVAVFTRDAGDFVRADLALARGNGADVAVADVNDDGLLDVVALVAAGFVEPFMNDGAGGWSAAPEVDIGSRGAMALRVVDLAGDGLPELVTGGTDHDGVVVFPNEGGRLVGGVGCAAGSYYMELNTGRQGANKPDPVVTLREQYDEWADEQIGRPDGVTSQVSGRHIIQGDQRSTIRVAVRDRYAQAVTGALAFDVENTNDRAVLTSSIQVVPLGGGEYDVEFATNYPDETGDLVISVDDGSGPVQLVPAFEVRTVPYRADFNGDGVVSLDDLALFVTWYLADDHHADLDGDGDLDLDDIAVLASWWLGT